MANSLKSMESENKDDILQKYEKIMTGIDWYHLKYKMDPPSYGIVVFFVILILVILVGIIYMLMNRKS